MQSQAARAHSILDYIITTAAASGKLYKSTIKIPYLELKSEMALEAEQEFEDMELVIEFRPAWVSSEDVANGEGVNQDG